MDDTTTKQIRDAGGLVGFTNEDEWAQLVATHGLEQVLAAVVRVRKASGRGAFISGVRVDLGAKAREPAPPRQALKLGESAAPGGAVAAEAAIAKNEAEAGASTMAVSTCGTLVDPGDVEQVDESDEQVDEEPLEQETAPQPAAKKLRRGAANWREVLRANPGSTKRELAAASQGGTEAGVSVWLSTHREETVNCGTPNGTNKPRRFWLKGAAGAPAPGSTPEATKPEEKPARRPARPIPKSTPSTQVTPTVEESAPTSGEVVQATEDAVPSGTLVTGEDLRERLKDAPEPPKTGLIILNHELAGPLRPLLELLLDAFAHRRGYAHTVRELEGCQDLVAVRGRG